MSTETLDTGLGARRRRRRRKHMGAMPTLVGRRRRKRKGARKGRKICVRTAKGRKVCGTRWRKKSRR